MAEIDIVYQMVV